jgi:hypothetical protein
MHGSGVPARGVWNFCSGSRVSIRERMRRHVQLILPCIFLLGAIPPAPAQDARKIVEQSVKAAGGSKAVSSIRTLSLQGTVAGSGDAAAGTFTLETKLPNRY